MNVPAGRVCPAQRPDDDRCIVARMELLQAAGADPVMREQIAALPWKPASGGIKVLLVTSRGTGRWVLPKGWIEDAEDAAAAAAREAREEAGVVGDIAKAGYGFYTYDKRLDGGPSIRCRVKVYPLKVSRQLRSFKEAGERQIVWFDSDDAADAVKEKELADLIRSFAAGI